MAVVQSVPRGDTWEDYVKSHINFCMPNIGLKPEKVAIIFNCYNGHSTKHLTQLQRGAPEKRVFITSANQSMPKGKQWEEFLHNSLNKTELIHFLVTFVKNNRNFLKVPMMVTETKRHGCYHPHA